MQLEDLSTFRSNKKEKGLSLSTRARICDTKKVAPFKKALHPSQHSVSSELNITTFRADLGDADLKERVIIDY